MSKDEFLQNIRNRTKALEDHMYVHSLNLETLRFIKALSAESLRELSSNKSLGLLIFNTRKVVILDHVKFLYNRDKWSIPQIVRELDVNWDSMGVSAKLDKIRLGEIRVILKEVATTKEFRQVKEFRNNHIAHMNFSEEALKIEFGYLESTFSLLCSLYNEISLSLFGQSIFFEPNGDSGVRGLITQLLRYRQISMIAMDVNHPNPMQAISTCLRREFN